MQKNTIYYISIFLLLSIIVTLFLNYQKNNITDDYLNNKTKQYFKQYNAIYKQYKKLANMIFTTKINTHKILKILEGIDTNKEESRKKLFNYLKDDYLLLKKYNVKQLHFHLPNNESFLRLHKPLKYGDDLSNIRATVSYVNKNKKPIDGFEEGRFYNGYRFVYPLYIENRYLCSVEISFSTFALNKEFMESYNLFSTFLVLKSTVDNKVFEEEKKNYVESPFKNFYFEKMFLNEISKIREIKQIHETSSYIKQIANNQLLNDNSFSIYDYKDQELVTFLKVKNPITKKVIGIFVIKNSDTFIRDKLSSFYVKLCLSILVIALILYMIYKELKQKEFLSFRINQELEKNKEIQEKLFRSEKMASMGEMIGNIAHQWRQPLSVISTASTGIKLKKEFNKLDDEELLKVCDTINDSAQFLSQTIEDFRNFLRDDRKVENYNLEECIEQFLNIIKPSLKSHEINISIEIDKNINLVGSKNELIQCLINLFNNSKDAFNEKDIEDKHIFINTMTHNHKINIEFKDNAGGVPENIIHRIFEPYFTTKHSSVGTGLGLHMTYRLITDGVNGDIEVKNVIYKHYKKEYTGAQFTIQLKG